MEVTEVLLLYIVLHTAQDTVPVMEAEADTDRVMEDMDLDQAMEADTDQVTEGMDLDPVMEADMDQVMGDMVCTRVFSTLLPLLIGINLIVCLNVQYDIFILGAGGYGSAYGSTYGSGLGYNNNRMDGGPPPPEGIHPSKQ